MIQRYLFFTIIIMIIFYFDSEAQNIQELVTDRPDVTESAIVVPVNSVQVETGFNFQKQKFTQNLQGTEVDNLTFASTLIRYGINEKIELRFGGEYLSSKTTIEELSSTISGVTGLFVGTKFNIWNNHEIINDLAIILEANLPYGNNNLRPEKIEPVITVSASQDFFEVFSFGLNLGFENNSSLSKNIYYYSSSISMGLDQRVSMYMEIYGDATNGFYPRHSFDGGFTYLHKHNLQLDISAGMLLFNDESEWFGGFGICIRLPE